ncbi:MAG TPA: DNA-binding protein [Candidatus Blautia merdavium]|uniref:DNA-binding protein n=1 Tax=Candidatus Blautia merdavium TaxID=2838494 RepID=A0A9D2PNJ3_9FIRM|nr:DNA-binding protein [Candidatus Blautia merdavium]
MEYRRFGNTVYLRLDPGEEILEEVEKLAEKEKIALAQISGIGAVNDFTAGVYNTVSKEYHSIRFQGAYEIVSLSGTVTQKDGEVYLHIHMSAGDEEGKVSGGHLNRAVISATGEIVLQITEGTVERKFSEEIGLNLFRF